MSIIIMTDRIYLQLSGIKSVTLTEQVVHNNMPNQKINKQAKSQFIINIFPGMPDAEKAALIAAGNFYGEEGQPVFVTISDKKEAYAEMKQILSQIKEQRTDDVHLQKMFEKHFSEAPDTKIGVPDDGSTKGVRKAGGAKGGR